MHMHEQCVSLAIAVATVLVEVFKTLYRTNLSIIFVHVTETGHARIQRGEQGVRPPPPEKSTKV